MRNKREKLKAEIANLARAVAEGHRSAALLDELGKRERELDSISEELLAADGRGLDARLQEIEEFVQKRLQDIRGLLFADVPRAKAELSKHCTAITLTPEAAGFRISGDWNLLGGRSGWCRGPESNWLRPPFQGGALPLSYPGTCGLEIVWGATRPCQFAWSNSSFSKWPCAGLPNPRSAWRFTNLKRTAAWLRHCCTFDT